MPNKYNHREVLEMKLVRLGSIAVVLIVLVCCGCSDKTLSSGTYRLSHISIIQDECNMKDYLIVGHEIKVTVKDNAVTIDWAEDATPLTGTIVGDTFTASASKDADMIPDTDCRDKWLKKITGTLVTKDSFTGTYEFNDKTISGKDCNDESQIGFMPPSCTSTMTFTATKK
jgi:major membrane immunogen (membrane-anchored lipoprotein)